MLLIKKIFDYLVWVLFFGLFLLGGIIYATNRTYPGDYLYPFKLKFEDFALVTSRILNKQVDFSIDLVSKRSNEVAKVLTSKNAGETLNRLDTQVETTAISIAQISNPIEKKKAAEKYIIKLNEVSSVLTEKQKDLNSTPTTTNTSASQPITQPIGQQIQNKPQNIMPTAVPLPPTSPEASTVSQQIDNTQATVEQTIDQMNELVSQTPTDSPESDEDRDRSERERKEKEEKEKKEKEDRESEGRDRED